MHTLNRLKNLKGKKVLVRCDFDLPLKNGKISDDSRLKNSLATINYLLKRQAKLVLIGHLGRPQGKKNKLLSLLPVKNRLEKYLRQKIDFIDIDRYLNQPIRQQIKQSSARVVLLENLRFSDREQANCRRFAKNLASLADYYVNEAFAVSHRRVASVAAIQNYLPAYYGLHLAVELKHLSAIKKHPSHPLVVIIGGAKTETKLPLLKNFIQRADYFLLGGAVANTFLKALGYQLGKSLIDPACLPQAQAIIKQLIKLKQEDKLILPVDVKTQHGVKRIDEIKSAQSVLDIGPQSIKLYSSIIQQAKAVIWNGPLGKFENQAYRRGTQIIAREILNSHAQVVVGGGDTHLIFKNKIIPQHVFISSGGGAMLAFLAGQPMPGLGEN